MALAWRTPVTGQVAANFGTFTIVVSLTGFSVGDLMLVAASSQAGATSCSPPSGWTEVHDLVGAGAVLGVSYYRIKDGSDGSTATFTFASDGFTYAYAAVAAYDSGGLLAISAATSAATTTDSGNTDISFPAVPAPGAGGYLGLAFACPRGQVNDVHQVTTSPTGWTKVAAREPVSTSPWLHPAIFAKANISSGGETPSSGVWSFNNYEANAVIGLKVAPAISAPVADFTGTPLSGDRPLSVAFTDTSSNSPTSWAWTFGDGGTSTSQNPTHSYTSAGTYTVALVATNAGGSNTKTRSGYVAVANPSGTMTKIKWGDHLVATDEGGGVIRVDYVP